jgi:serine/threonine protein kinase
VLGRGSYGKVFLARHAGRAYACKMVCKQRTIKQKQVAAVCDDDWERDTKLKKTERSRRVEEVVEHSIKLHSTCCDVPFDEAFLRWNI